MAYRDSEAGRKRNRERFRERTKSRRAAGLCLLCGQRPPEPDRRLCTDCIRKKREADRARYAWGKATGLPYGGRRVESRRNVAKVRSARIRQERLDAGLCARCGDRRPAEGGTVCTECRARRQAADRSRYAQLRAVELCVKCGKVGTFDGAALCAPCTALEAESGRIERKNAASRKRYAERRARGVYTDCG